MLLLNEKQKTNKEMSEQIGIIIIIAMEKIGTTVFLLMNFVNREWHDNCYNKKNSNYNNNNNQRDLYNAHLPQKVGAQSALQEC